MTASTKVLYEFLMGIPSLIKIGLLYGNQLYEVRFDERGVPSGQLSLDVLKIKLETARGIGGLLLIESASHLQLVTRQEDGSINYSGKSKLRGVIARDEQWTGLHASEIHEAFSRERSLSLVARPEDVRVISTLLPDELERLMRGNKAESA